MAYERKEIPASEIRRQEDVCREIFDVLTSDGRRPLAMVDTYGCQQNESDSEKIRGYLALMGCSFTTDEFQADIMVVNTCAVREHAEMRVLGNVGALTHTKAKKPGQIIAVCGCMVQQEHMAEKIKKSYPIVDLVFGPHELWRFPELLKEVMTTHGRVFAADKCEGAVAEGLPKNRDGAVKAWLSIMYGCNNFCTYCVVPYVRGRERSRRPEDIVSEARELVAAGYKDITLLGQNVNSYGKDLDSGTDFSDLIRMFATHYHELSALEGKVQGVKNYNITAKKQGGTLVFLRKIVSGAADDSYGIEVAKLAGVPDPVINKAKDYLKELESTGAAPAPAAKKSGDGQLSLADVGADEVKDILRGTDLNTLTPIEAMAIHTAASAVVL